MIEEKHCKTKDLLLEAAKDLFVKRGYQAVGTREIADLAGVNLGAIQYHFGSKAKLFIEMVHLLMNNTKNLQIELALSNLPQSREAAVQKLRGFVSGFLAHLLRSQDPQVCRLMVREIMTDATEDQEMIDELVSSVAEQFIRPVHQSLVQLISKINPELSSEKLGLSAQSIIGQCVYYSTNRPFVEHLHKTNISQSPTFEEIVNHISTFSLQALGYSSQAPEDNCSEGQAGGEACEKQIGNC